MTFRLIGAATAVGALVVAGLAAPASATPSTSAHPAAGKSSGKVVYLTFDDGPNPVWTPQVLKLLKLYDAKATFFMVGSRAADQPDLVGRVRAAGHAVGNHTWSHISLKGLPAEQITDEIRRTDAALGGTSCVRPPFGDGDATGLQVLQTEHKNLAMWTVDPEDWSRPGVTKIVRRVLDKTANGSIVLMHDGGGEPRLQTTAALATILPVLKARGYRFETLPACR